MATADSISPWIPEDDILLKNAIEGGASFEALAKGAVRFSRRLTVQELKHRWHSLLYDPEVSNHASGRMVEYELSSFQHPTKSHRVGSSKSSPQVPVKRKVDSVRKLYYEMRKRLRLEACNSIDLDFPNKPLHDEPDFRASNYQLQQLHNEKIIPLQPFPVTDLSRKDSLKAKQIPNFDFLYNDLGIVCSGFVGTQCSNSPISDDGAAFHSMGFSSPLQQGSLWKMTEDVSAPRMPIDMNLREKDDSVEVASIVPRNNDEGNLHFMDVDLNTMDKSCDDNLNSLLLNSPNNSNEDDVSTVTEIKMQLLRTCVASPSGPCPVEIELTASQLTTNLDVQHHVCYLNDTVPSSSAIADSYPYEAPDGIILCALNTEDEDIPCIGHIFSSKQFHNSDMQSSELLFLFANQTNRAQDVRSTNNKERRTPHFSASQVPGREILANNYHVEFDQCGPAYLSENVSMSKTRDKDENRAKLKELDAPAIIGQHLPLHVEPDLTGVTHIQSGSNRTTPDHEERYSDDDLPSFSDVEAMILEMDLCQDDGDSFPCKEVSGYQHKDNKRQMLRLEQSAQSSLRRAIASQGALAILHGHYSRHYIKKVEVILGRATDDIDVDIDLATEGRANRISRRQASIKLEKDGSFYLKNLGKSLISVNGKDVATGQYLTLNSSCLIEIREIRFVFEVNYKSIRRFLAKAGGKCQENNGRFEWSREGFQ